MIVTIPAFEPDKSPFNTNATDVLLNVLPTADGIGPMLSMVTQSEALPSECLGAVFTINENGQTTIIAGTQTNLYKLNTATSPYSWDSIGSGYNVPVGDKWQFDVFGDLLIATNLGDYPQKYNIQTGGTFSDLTAEFKARYVRSVGDFVMFGYLENEPDKVRWSGLNNAEWWTSGQRGADEQILPTGGDVMGIIGDSRGALILLRSAMQLMPYAPGSGYTFTRSEANTKRGTIAPHSIVQIGQDQFAYLSEDGFFAGIEGTPIGAEKVDRWFLNELDRDYLFDVKGMADPFNKIVWWRYRNTEGQDRLLGYDWQLNKWCQSNEQITEAAALAAPGIPWDGLDLLYDTIDDVNIPFDSPIFEGGKPVFAGFTTDNKLAFYGGAALQATIETAWTEPTPGGRSFLNEGRLIGDATNHTVASGVLDFHGDNPAYKTAVSPSARTGRLPLRADGRLHRQRIVIPAGESWTAVNGINLNFASAGHL